MKEEISLAVKQALIKVLALEPGFEIKPHFKLRDDLGLDSMTSLMFLMTLEEAIDGFVVNPNTLEIENLETVESITNYVLSELIVHIEEPTLSEEKWFGQAER